MKRHPIAVDIRRKAGKRLKTDVSSQVLVTSIEDQIAALERELNNTDGSESENESESEISDHSVSNIKDVGVNKTNCVSSELVEVRDSSGNIVSLKSALEGQHIMSICFYFTHRPCDSRENSFTSGSVPSSSQMWNSKIWCGESG